MKQFTVTEAHLKLAKEMQVGWCGDEFGAPEIDPKRPYGNSDVLGDMAEILDLPKDGEDAALTPMDVQERELRELHESMETALQIFLATGTFEVGDYEADDYRNNWARV